MTSGYQAVPAISDATLTRSRLMLMVAGDPPPPVGTSAPGAVTDAYCRKSPTVKDETIDVPLFDPRCIHKITGKGKDDKLTVADRQKLTDWITKQGTWAPVKDAEGVMRNARDFLWAYWSASSGTRGSITKASDLKRSFSVETFQQRGYWPNDIRVKDIPVFREINNTLEFAGQVGGILSWVVNPDHIMGILAIVIGAGLVIISYPKVLGDG